MPWSGGARSEDGVNEGRMEPGLGIRDGTDRRDEGEVGVTSAEGMGKELRMTPGVWGGCGDEGGGGFR